MPTRKKGFDVEFVYADEEITNKHILDKIDGIMRRAEFGLFDITRWNPNVTLELGLAIGRDLDYYILFNPTERADAPSDLGGIDRIQYHDYTELRQGLRKLLRQKFGTRGREATQTSTGPAIAVYVPDTPCETYPHAAGGASVYCHLEVAAISDVLRRCHARLIRVERAVAQKWVRDSRFATPARLKWASFGPEHPEAEYRDIRPGEPALLDVLYTLERSPGQAFIETLGARPVEPSRELETGAYLLTIRVIADGRDPVDHTLSVGVPDARWWKAVTMGSYIGPPLAQEPDAFQVQLQKAALLLRTELLDIRNKIANFGKDVTIPEGFAFPSFEWQKYRELIANDQGLYEIVSEAYTQAHRVNEIFAWRRTVSTSRLIGVNDSDGLVEADTAANAAVVALSAVIAD